MYINYLLQNISYTCTVCILYNECLIQYMSYTYLSIYVSSYFFLFLALNFLLDMYTSDRTINITAVWYYGVRAVGSYIILRAYFVLGRVFLRARDLRTHLHAHMLTYAYALVDSGSACICCACVDSLPFLCSTMGCQW